MIPVELELCNVLMGKGQEEYRGLPGFVDKQKVVTWKFTKKEMETIENTGCIYIAVFNQGQPLQPILPSTVITDILTAEQIMAIPTYETVEVDQHAVMSKAGCFVLIKTVRRELVDTPCPACGAELGEPCWKGMINDDGFMEWKIHKSRLKE